MVATLRRAFLLPLALAWSCGPGDPESESEGPSAGASDGVVVRDTTELGRFFGEIAGTFVLLDGQTGRVTRYDPERAAQRFLPASTYKIPNSLIALETGVADGSDFPLAWDSVRAPRQEFWPESWARDHVLRTALRNSVVWYYQELARRIGPERTRAFLDRFGYGNGDISGGIDRFWLSGGLRISADEQVRFLEGFYDGELGLSPRTTAIVKEMLILEETGTYRLSGKTGWTGLDGVEDPVGWLVGYVERGPDVWFFALNLRIRPDVEPAARERIARAILGELGLLDG